MAPSRWDPRTAAEAYPLAEARARLMERYNTRVVTHSQLDSTARAAKQAP